MSELGAVWAALELFGSDFDRWPTVIIHSAFRHLVGLPFVIYKVRNAPACRQWVV